MNSILSDEWMKQTAVEQLSLGAFYEIHGEGICQLKEHKAKAI